MWGFLSKGVNMKNKTTHQALKELFDALGTLKVSFIESLKSDYKMLLLVYVAVILTAFIYEFK